MLLRYFEENLTRNAYKAGPLEEARIIDSDPVQTTDGVDGRNEGPRQRTGVLVDVDGQ